MINIHVYVNHIVDDDDYGRNYTSKVDVNRCIDNLGANNVAIPGPEPIMDF